MDSAIRCPRCHNAITPGAECQFCGYGGGADLSVAADKRTWQETCYLIAAAVMVLQGAMVAVAGYLAMPPLAFIGIGLAVVGIGMWRDQTWAHWTARVVGILALLTYGRLALMMVLSLGTVPNAAVLAAVNAAWFAFWIFVEYLIWAVTD